MIATIIDTFKKQAREHKTIRAFYFNKNYELGSGKDMYPLLWLEDPINGRNSDNVFANAVNFSVLFVPKDETAEHLQNLAFSIGLNIIERLRQDRDTEISIVPNWSYMTVRNYYDDNACGCRFSVSFTQRNMQSLCLIDEQFDKEGVFESPKALNDFNMHPADNCEVFVNKFPLFDLKTRK